MRSRLESGLSPERTTAKTIKQEAIAFLEAKKPLVVEKRPVRARAKVESPTIGER